jgi:hypothetical protein
MRRRILLVAGLLAGAGLLWGLTVNGSLSVLGTLTAVRLDMSGAVSTRPVREASSAPATCATGEQYFNTASKTLWVCSATDVWGQVGGSSGGVDPTDVSLWWFREDFTPIQVSGSLILGEQSWWKNNIGSPAGAALAASNNGNTKSNPGLVKLSSGTTASAGLALAMDPYGYRQGLLGIATQTWKTKFVFALGQTTQIRANVGWHSKGGLYTAADAVYVGMDYTAASTATNFKLVVSNWTGTVGTYDTGVAGDLNYHTVTMRGDGTAVYAAWDGGTEVSFCPAGCTVTATLPDTSQDAVFQAFVTTADTTSKDLYLDFVGHVTTLGANKSKRN